MNSLVRFDGFEKKSMESQAFDMKTKLREMNKSFKSTLTPENGIFGVTEVVKYDGTLEKTYRNNQGLVNKEYYRDGKKYLHREKLSDGSFSVTKFDDNGTVYLKRTVKLGGNTLKTNSIELTPNKKIVKGNFTAETDFLGRPISNKIDNLILRGPDEARKNLNTIHRDKFYKKKDHKGHLIADLFGGPASKENVVAQLDDVNLSRMRMVENEVKRLKLEGNKVDFEVKTNYVGSNKRPSSFEPTITVNGKIHELSPDLQKIYNSNAKSIGKFATNLGERFGLSSEAALKSGLQASAVTFAVSTVDNTTKLINGEISAEDMVCDILKDTSIAGGVGFASTFVIETVAKGMKASSHSLIKSAGKLGVPAAVISFGIDAYDSISDFAQGVIDGKELLYNLGDNVASSAGSAAGMLAGAAIGSAVLGAGTAAGAVAVAGCAIGIVSSMVGCALSSEAYKTAVELGTQGVEVLAEKAQTLAEGTMDLVKTYIPEELDNVKNAISEFAKSNDLPFLRG